MNRKDAKNIGIGITFPDSPLFEAVDKDDIDKVSKLIANGEDIDCVRWAYREGLLPHVKSREMFDLLIKAGIPIIDDDTLYECLGNL